MAPMRAAGTSALIVVSDVLETGRLTPDDAERAVNAPHLVALVRAGARFERGHFVERPGAYAA
ncbi:hypothetical protein [Streptomyces sp. NPDC014734]|uniref:hypothetical protein n=1 Tax=Streptomyces sp. NPDC014734 TaxID=3364886 RepID=UPI0036FB9618